MNASKELLFIWYPATLCNQDESKPWSYFNEKNMSIDLCKSAIDHYADLSLIFTKSTGIRGFPGSEKLGVYNTVWSMRCPLPPPPP